uniref:Transmembrane protein n=1 Tax=Panagrolaimus superbus TaxID=310955 RepID=A0A914YLA5_9BILA
MSSFFYPTTFIFLLCFIITVNSAPLSNELSSPSNLYQNDLSSDSDSQHVIQYGNDVKLISPGSVELILTYRTLVVDVNIKQCIGKVLFCYESSKIENEAAKLCRNFDGFCGFQLIGTEDEIQFTKNTFIKSKLINCNSIQMMYASTYYCQGLAVKSCNPEIGAEGRIKIEISDVGCPVTIKNAKIYVPSATTSSTTSSILDSDSASNAGLQWYYWILIVFGILLIVFCGVGIWICVWKKNILSDCKKKPANPVPVESIVSTTVTQEIKTVTKDEKTKEEPSPKVKPKPKTSKPKTPKPSTEPASAPAPTGKPKEISKAAEIPLKKEAEKEKKKSKSKTPSTESYSAPFCLLPFPAQPFEPEPVQEPPAKKRPRNEEGRRSRHMDSLELADDRMNGIDTITKIQMERRKRSRKRY